MGNLLPCIIGVKKSVGLQVVDTDQSINETPRICCKHTGYKHMLKVPAAFCKRVVGRQLVVVTCVQRCSLLKVQ